MKRTTRADELAEERRSGALCVDSIQFVSNWETMVLALIDIADHFHNLLCHFGGLFEIQLFIFCKKISELCIFYFYNQIKNGPIFFTYFFLLNWEFCGFLGLRVIPISERRIGFLAKFMRQMKIH